MSDGANKGSFLSFVDLVCADMCVYVQRWGDVFWVKERQFK